MTDFSNCTVLIVDDTPTNIEVLTEALGDDFEISIALSGERALKIIAEEPPDLVLLDVMMPGMSGYEVCQKLKSDPGTQTIPVIFITALGDESGEATGLSLGAVDYIAKPFNPDLVKARVKNHLLLKMHQVHLEEMVKRRTFDLEMSQRSAVFMLGEAGHYHDEDTGVHIWRMAAYSAAIARCRKWDKKDVDRLELAAPMHDTGKIGIPDSILKKPARLEFHEREIMKTHSRIGHSILSKSGSPLFHTAAEIALYHHEKWDGTGYPEGLQGKNIPETARIVAICDVFDALTMQRPYKEAWPVEKAITEIGRNAGTHFDPELVDCFMKIQIEIRDINYKWNCGVKKSFERINIFRDI